MLDVPCDLVAQRLARPLDRLGILNDQNSCGPLPSATVRVVATAPYRDWWTLAPAVDTLAIQLLLPGHVQP